MYRYSARQYRKEFGANYERPGIFARLLSGVFRILPKIGPLRPFAFHVPTPEAEKFFRQSFAQTRTSYCELLAAQTGTAPPPPLPNTSFDTGKATVAGEYALADETYTKLLLKLEKDRFEQLSPSLRADLLRFFRAGPTPTDDKPEKTQEVLAQLQAAKPAATPAARPAPK